MEFLNLGYPIKIRIGESNDCYWKTIQRNEIVDLPESVGRQAGFITTAQYKIETTKGKLGNKVVETKQIEEVAQDMISFSIELQKINGIGKKTSEDIATWGTKEKLIEQIKKGNKIPFRDDIELKLRKKYG